MEMFEVSEDQIIPVSIIIPVYNVYEWLDQCLESVVSQTFQDFELLLINDGSEDGSDEKCRAWALKDKRIIYISKRNEGLSASRNLGIREARGVYVVFIDADDWIDIHYIEKLYTKASETDADVAECDIWRYNDITGQKTYRPSYGAMGRDYSLWEHMKYGNTAIWKCMIRREFLLRNGVQFPNCHSPARAVYALLLALGNRVVNVHEPLYYYRLYRKGSLSEIPRKATENPVIGMQAFDHLIEGFKKHGLYDEYEELLEGIVKYKLSDLLAAMFTRRSEDEFKILYSNYYLFIQDRFPKARNDAYITLGGYNLNRILWHVNLLHNPYCRFNFTSIISIVNPVPKPVRLTHKNKYREIMLNREMENSFWSILREIKPKYLFIDLIDERFDVVGYKGGYLTKSDAWEECVNLPSEIKVVSRDSEECMELWKRSSADFIENIEKEAPDTEIVLIKNYLCEQVGNIRRQEAYGNIGEIRKINCILEGYYDFFMSQCKKVRVIEALKCHYYFTDEQYEYGAVPSHLNEIVNDEIAKKVEAGIGI